MGGIESMDGTGFEPATGIEPAWMAGASGRARSHEDVDGMEWMWMDGRDRIHGRDGN